MGTLIALSNTIIVHSNSIGQMDIEAVASFKRRVNHPSERYRGFVHDAT